ncbi:succinyl-CoA synthetase subunit beta [Marinobacter sp. F3R08]|uniref:succinyl-CoA synthetase subunit beta n=1 Tax=Marinobacter sp. F3R08 TaxID=2841559 RepID=UPI001C09BDF8|nr:succinyl-CoA synthetase subunit beta [Marinobacter sp. F3R08]MBU2953853.1 succinyl-CoA synthetase subunit beta [Marinobacter sp. F3R08]
MIPGSKPGMPGTGRWLPLLAGAASLLIVPFLFIGGPDWASGPLFKSAWNLGHILLCALLTLAIRPWRWLSGWRLWLVVTAVLLAAGACVELIQHNYNRDMDGRDLLRNLIGGWLVIAWRPLILPRTPILARQILLAVTVTVLLCLELGTIGNVAIRQWQVHHQLPLLYDFRHEDPGLFWTGSLAVSVDHSMGHPHSLKIDLGTETYSGVSLSNLPADWRDFESLTITLFNPSSEPLTLSLRINDVTHDRSDQAYSDRYNTRLTLGPGFSTLTRSLTDIENAPHGRTMDMSSIRRMGLFAVRLPEPRTVYLSDLRLD